MSCAGEPIEFELASDDATTAIPLVIRNAGATTTRALAPNERVIIQAGHIYTSDEAEGLTVFSDADDDGAVDDGERMVLAGPGHTSFDFSGSTGGGIAGARGIVPKVIAPVAGDVAITGVGVIIKS